MKMKYNPFKMLGSWVGVIIGYVAILIIYLDYFPIPESLYLLLGGFLLGWGIHSLIRRYKK